jgi:hypothetical protein
VLERLKVRPDDRVLFLSIPAPEVVAEVAPKLSQGLLVGLGSADEVREARRHTAAIPNVMFVPAGPEEIPWQEHFFTVVVDLYGRWAEPQRVASEIARVLGPGGEAHLRISPEHRTLFDSNFAEIYADADHSVLRRLV